MRPGLADAAARAALPGAGPGAAGDSEQVAAEAPETVAPVEAAPVATVAVEPTVAATAVAEAAPEPYVEPARTVVTEVREPVFSLASVGNEAVPGAPATAETAATPEVPDGGEGTIWRCQRQFGERPGRALDRGRDRWIGWPTARRR